MSLVTRHTISCEGRSCREVEEFEAVIWHLNRGLRR